MKYLLDVNVLLAWGWADHADHRRTDRWIRDAMARKGAKILTSSIPEIGFVRISVQRSGGRVPVDVAAEALAGLVKFLGQRHEFIADNISAMRAWPAWCNSASRTTDAHLLALAANHGAQLVTLDTGIPGAFLIPA